MKIVLGIFFILHGLVHLLYAGQSVRLFELRPGLIWPDGSWLFSKLLGDGATRIMAGILLALAALVLIAGGLGLILSSSWWRPVVVAAASFSSLLFILLWNGRLKVLDEQGAVGLLFDLLILVIVLIFKWPA
jgi:uncharacterized protein YjeT (DUF2065 family)